MGLDTNRYRQWNTYFIEVFGFYLSIFDIEQKAFGLNIHMEWFHSFGIESKTFIELFKTV